MVLQSCLIFTLSTRQRETSFNASFMCSLLGFYSSYFFQSHCRDLKPKKKKITIQSSFVDIGHRCHIISCADGKRRHLIPKQQEKKKKKSHLLLGLRLKSFVWSHCVLSCGIISHVILTEEIPVPPAEKNERKQNVVFAWKATA